MLQDKLLTPSEIRAALQCGIIRDLLGPAGGLEVPANEFAADTYGKRAEARSGTHPLLTGFEPVLAWGQTPNSFGGCESPRWNPDQSAYNPRGTFVLHS